ncbi:hypothetical protein M9978_16365 [Sphingomonas sp. MG17]|uniref:Uncharacterized protein n=1 Tax=Sphingomonas tagetis TaxID=2949092 RepID=A0A9X2HU37_9SPHN|nr:hypothetical protein [Sphingomonas tagetis]MCP3732000.1 hypothetical protein [Sphingomonas tagetis]
MAKLSIDEMRAQVEAHDAKLRAEKAVEVGKLIASPAFADVLTQIEALGTEGDAVKPFGPATKAARLGLQMLASAHQREVKAG